MTNEALLTVLGYCWAFFGAYWMSVNVLKPDPGAVDRRLKFAFLMATFTVLFAGRRVIPPLLLLILSIAWTSVGLSWGAPSSAAHSGEFKWYRLLRLFVLAGVFALLFWKATAAGVLGRRFVPDLSFFGVLGFAAAIAGMLVTLWSRIVLGKYWSDKVIVQSEHQLVRSGPYARIRHPLYSGVLLAVLGTALVVGEIRGLLSFLILLANYAIKAKTEERILRERFGVEFNAHLRNTGFLFPRLRRM